MAAPSPPQSSPERIRVLFLSPHPDDIAWSLGGTVAHLAETDAELFGLTVFCRTLYAPGSAAHGSSAATKVRAIEDANWAALTGVRLERCDLPDASLRGYDDDTEMGAEPEPEIVLEVMDHLQAVLAAVRPHMMLVPLAVGGGGHVDHRAVRLAAYRLAPRHTPEMKVLWYEDLPYAEGLQQRYSDHPVLVDVRSRWAAREAGIRCYPSQEPETILPVIRRHLAAVSGERLWAGTSEAALRFGRLVARDAVRGIEQGQVGAAVRGTQAHLDETRSHRLEPQPW